ncbi:MAG: hypothetical protein PCFJNLEI_03950 [Verrucomicrobiae bacterium]|nr:hypothetical protein [Verrucomicrobiae bacterium]
MMKPLILALAVLLASSRLGACADFDCYEVAALSSIPRLPNRLPSDARLGARLRVVAAQGEFEPASFVVSPRVDVAKFELKSSALVSSVGEIAASNVDIKVVKCWYQGGTAWYSYFADNNRRELVPELLLNDETLIKVDNDKRENYLRVGNEYRWISYPKEKATEAFNYLTESVADSKTLLPVRLTKGENKQFWVTIKVPEGVKTGNYVGTINLIANGKAAGQIEILLKVLPFQLPLPRTYYDVNAEYLVTLMGTGILGMCDALGMPVEAAEKQQVAIYKNLLDHNVLNCRSDLTLVNKRDRDKAIADLKRELELMTKAGFVMKPLISRGWAYWGGSEENKMDLFKSRIDDLVKTLTEAVGHHDIYLATWDEANTDRVKVLRELAEYVGEKGLKLWATTAKGRHFDLAGYCIDYADHGGWPDREIAATWHSVGAKVASYAGPHTGPENPDVFRRWEGLARYKANYDGSFNYLYFSALHPTLYQKQKANVWNDFLGDQFRRMNLVYPTANGMIDTLAWEGFREGIDDGRYATKLKQDAAQAIASGKWQAVFAAKKALMWLELLDERTADLNAVRLEMIEYISKIQTAMEN